MDRITQRIVSATGNEHVFGGGLGGLGGKALDEVFLGSLHPHQWGVIRNVKGRHVDGHVFPVALEAQSWDRHQIILHVTEMDDTLEGMVNVDANGVVTSASLSCRILLGYSPSEMAGLPLARLWDNVCLTSGKKMICSKHKDGSRFLLVASITEYSGARGRSHCKVVIRRSIPSGSAVKISDSRNGAHGVDGLVGWYRVERSLGTGFFGTVSLATHRLTGYHVAIKPLEQKRYEDAGLEFPPREIQLLWKLKHTNIVHLYDILYAERAVYIVMEVVKGRELFDYVLQKERLDEDEARKVFCEIVSAVDYMHRSGVVHRDLKLENIMVDEQGHIKIIDFGLGNFFHPKARLSTFCGTPDYCAPELLHGRSYVGPEVDVWSLGVILYVLVTGFMPFADNQRLMSIEYCFPETIRVSLLLKDLVSGIFRLAQSRLSMEQVLAHPWLDAKMDRIPIHEPITTVNSAIVAEMELLGFSAADVQDAVLRDAHDQITTTYYLIAHNRTHQSVAREEREHTSSVREQYMGFILL